MGEFGGIISASIVYRGEESDCRNVTEHVGDYLAGVPTRLEQERSGQWTVLVPFSDTAKAQKLIHALVRDGVVPEGA